MTTWTEVLTQQKSYTITELIPNTQYTLSINGVSDGTIEAYLGGAKIGEFVDNRITFTPSQPHTTLTIKTFGDLFLANIKLEKGSVAHKWTPAPEDKSIPKIRFFEHVKIISKPHEIDDSMLIKKQTIHLDDPSQNTIEVGVEVSSFTDKQLETNNTIKKINADYVTNEKMTNVITPITIQVSQIIQQADSIELSVSELRTDLENIERETTAKIDVTTELIQLEKSTRETELYGTGEVDEDGNPIGGLIASVRESAGRITILDDKITEEVNSRTELDGRFSEYKAQTELGETYWQVDIANKLTGKVDQEVIDLFNIFFRVDLQKGAIIGRQGQPVQIVIDNDRILFQENEVTFAYWEGGTMHVDHIIATITATIGYHQISKYDSPYGKTSLIQIEQEAI